MFVHWKIAGLPPETREESVAHALTYNTTVETVAPAGFDKKGLLDITVYFSSLIGDSPQIRAGLAQSYQALLRHRLGNPAVVIEEVPQR